jgi:hypothetical protein
VVRGGAANHQFDTKSGPLAGHAFLFCLIRPFFITLNLTENT